MTTKEDPPILRVALFSDSRRLASLLRQSLVRYEVQVETYIGTPPRLEQVLERNPHVVLLDCPQKQALEVAEAVSIKSPTTGIVLMAKTMTRASLVASMRAGVTQIIVRPFALTTLIDQVRGAMEKVGGGIRAPRLTKTVEVLGEPGKREEVIAELRRVDAVKAVPHVVARVMEITGSDDGSGATELEQVIKSDTNISAIVLKRANSSYYAVVHKITRIRDAITRIGFREVRGIVLAVSVINAGSAEQQQVGLDRNEFWKSALASAILAEELAKELKQNDASDLFIYGLLADFGLLVLDEHLTQRLETAINLTHEERIPLGVAQMRVLGMNHAQVGAFVLSEWRFPDEAIELICAQQTPEEFEALGGQAKMLASCVWLARWIVQGLGIGDRAELLYDYAPAWMLSNLKAEQLITDDLLRRLIEQVNQIMSLFRVELDWPQTLTQAQKICFFESEPASLSPLSLLIRRVGSSPVKVESGEALKALPADEIALIQVPNAEALKQLLGEGQWGDRAWLFVMPRGEFPADDTLKDQVGLPTGRCGYVEYPFQIETFTTELGRVVAGDGDTN